MHRAALIKLVQEIVTRALINFKWYVEERRLSVNTMQTRNVRTLKLSKVCYTITYKYYGGFKLRRCKRACRNGKTSSTSDRYSQCKHCYCYISHEM